jgi:hypothetical protein
MIKEQLPHRFYNNLVTSESNVSVATSSSKWQQSIQDIHRITNKNLNQGIPVAQLD